ncbi:lariat debranching enzyme, C-terminal domain-containing protein [Pestalotiopsis sp. NC0098]|nr:lariat debranching enzyme, C-terminal domain-containing protein [Pestalotiopsis sp. NC0098]
MEASGQPSLLESGGVRVAIQGCGHGHLDLIYKSVQNAAETRGWDAVDLLIIGGDFQAVRNAADLTVMSVPIKYRKLGDFPEYYSGRRKAPVLTIFIGGNHEAISHSWELYYGGWVAPNIYYLGAANVLRFGPIRIAGISGIWSEPDYNKTHMERLPFNHKDNKSFYHIREFDIRKLLQITEQVDIGLSHDWPRGIERDGDEEAFWRLKPFLKQAGLDGTLGNPAATTVLDRLRPLHWFSAHLHCHFTALRRHDAIAIDSWSAEPETKPLSTRPQSTTLPEQTAKSGSIDVNVDGEETHAARPIQAAAVNEYFPVELRVQPSTASIFNTETRFLALGKCPPGQKHLELCYIKPATVGPKPTSTELRLEYDPEWLAITRVFHQYITIGDRNANPPADKGEEVYAEMIDKERVWVDEHIVAQNKLAVPENFMSTAPPHNPGDPEAVSWQPEEYTNPQTALFCELLQIKNLWVATSQERKARKQDAQPRHGNHDGQGGGEDNHRKRGV